MGFMEALLGAGITSLASTGFMRATESMGAVLGA